jgi:hypothetical protein
MFITVHSWNKPRYRGLDAALRALDSIDTNTAVKLEVPVGKFIAKAKESVLYNPMDGTYLMYDDEFVVEGASEYDQHPLAGECKKNHGSYKGDVQTTLWFIIVADKPFRVKQSYMEQDSETWGTFDATIGSYYTESEPVTE